MGTVKRILYIHNSCPEYRYGYFLELNKICELTIAFTDIGLGRQIYGEAIDDDRLNRFNHVLLVHEFDKDKKILSSLIANNGYDLVIIPALDDIYHIRLSKDVIRFAKQKNITIGFFWEKWRADPNKQSIKRRFKEYVQSCLIKPLLKNIDIFWAPGRKTKEYLINNGVEVSRIKFIHDSSVCNEENIVHIRKKYNIPNEMSIVLYFGRLVAYKGADVLIEAFAKTNPEYQKNHFLLIAGSGSREEEYKELAKKKHLINYCFTGFVNSQNRASYFKESDCFVLPVKVTNGKVEAWGLTINEAIQYNNFIITTDAVGSAYELVTEKNGIMLEENDIDDLRNALEKTVDFEEVMRENDRITREYTYEQMAFDIVSPLQEN